VVADAVRKQTEERRDVLIIEWAEEPWYYVQFPHPATVPSAIAGRPTWDDEPEWLYSEASSDFYRPPPLHIGERGANDMMRLGWRPPKSARDKLEDVYMGGAEVENWFRVFPLNVGQPYESIAVTIVETFRTGFGCADGLLKVDISPSSTLQTSRTHDVFLISLS
jgi:hypothetical protein